MGTLQSIREEVLSMAKHYEAQNLVQKLVNLEDELEISVVLLGEFSSGKTTLANVMLGQELLPTGSTPVTAALVELVKGSSLRTFVQKSGKEELEEIPVLEVSSYISGKEASSVERVVIEVPESKFIPHHFKIVDTPGLSSLDEVSEKITLGYLPFCDVALIVLDANQGGLTHSLLRFLKEKLVVEIDSDRIFFLVNKIDTISPEEVEKIVEEVRKAVSEVIPEPIVLPLSALMALKGDYQKSGFETLEKLLQEKVFQQKEKMFYQK